MDPHADESLRPLRRPLFTEDMRRLAALMMEAQKLQIQDATPIPSPALPPWLLTPKDLSFLRAICVSPE
jgi:hypothetical protein